MTTRPRLYLDVDGVLNAFPYRKYGGQRKREPDVASPWGGDWAFGDAREYPITWAPELVDALNEVLAHPDGPDLVWATTWEDNAPKYIRPLLGIEVDPRREKIVWARQGRTWRTQWAGSIDWKTRAIRHRENSTTNRGPWVHFDDEIKREKQWGNVYKDRLSGYQTHYAPHHNGLAIGPKDEIGITPEQWGSALLHWDGYLG